ncbi:hypothetical protein ABL850_09500 [Variovorax paradoxus]
MAHAGRHQLVIGLLAAPGLVASGSPILQAASAAAPSTQAPVAAKSLVAGHGFAGLGYIATATYLPYAVCIFSYPKLHQLKLRQRRSLR